MCRHLHRCCLAVLLAVSSGGCATWKGARTGLFRPKPTFAETGDDSALAKSDSKSSKTASPSAKTPPALLSERSRSEETWDAATERLVEDELRDATPRERTEWLSRFESMTSVEIAAALRERRSALAGDADSSRSRTLEAPDLPGTSPALANSSADLPDPIVSEEPDDGNIRTASTAAIDRRMETLLEAASPGSRSSRETTAAARRESPPGSGSVNVEEPIADLWETPPIDQSGSESRMPPVGARLLPPEVDPPANDLAVVDVRSPMPPSADAGIESDGLAPRIEPSFTQRLADWDPTKLIPRRKPVERPGSPLSDDVDPPDRTDDGSTPSLPPYTGNVAAIEPAGSASLSNAYRMDPQSSYTADELRRIITLMEAEALASAPEGTPEEQREYVRKHIHLRLLRLVAGQTDAAQQPIPGLDPVDQEFWNAVLWGMSTYFDRERVPDPTERAALTAAQFQTAARHLKATARLELKNVAFCHRIEGFGAFERFSRDEFQAGVPVLIYAEIRNFGSDPQPDGHYRTTLKSTVEIVRVGQQNLTVDRMSFDPTADLSRSPRTDFYNSYKINLPTTLTPGPYQLRLTVEDETSGKIANQTLNFAIR